MGSERHSVHPAGNVHRRGRPSFPETAVSLTTTRYFCGWSDLFRLFASKRWRLYSPLGGDSAVMRVMFAGCQFARKCDRLSVCRNGGACYVPASPRGAGRELQARHGSRMSACLSCAGRGGQTRLTCLRHRALRFTCRSISPRKCPGVFSGPVETTSLLSVFLPGDLCGAGNYQSRYRRSVGANEPARPEQIIATIRHPADAATFATCPSMVEKG